MSDTKWTKEQHEAITTKGCNLLVAAAAGAGKTAVLVERIIRKIIDGENPVDIDSLLVVTFTNAAATEMRERIGAAISKELEEARDSDNIRRQLALLNKASITTIHSFCLEVIRNNFQSIDIDPGFRILDETEAALLKLETLNELFEEIYEDEENNSDFFELLESYGSNRDDQKLQDMVLNIYSFVQSYPWPEQWLSNQAENFNPGFDMDFGKTVWGKILLQSVVTRLRGLQSLVDAACKKLKYAPGFEKYLTVFFSDAERLGRLLDICERSADTEKAEASVPSGESGNGWDEIHSYLKDFVFETLPRCGKDTDESIKDSVKQTRDELKGYIKNLKEEVFLQKSDEITADLRAMHPVLKCVARLVIEFGSRYSQRKHQKSAVDFNDLEHFCLKILSEADENGKIRPTKVAETYKQKFSEILVDEYQDSNLVQEIIISMISREDKGTPNVFMVGDVKQSIYRFRQAKPELFLNKYNQYSQEPESLYRKILLYKNFRSRKEVVDGVNFIFRQIMTKSVGELDYSEDEKLNPGAGYPDNQEEERLTGGEIELHLMETASTQSETDDNDSENDRETGGDPETEDEIEAEEILDNIQKEARMVANRIVELLQPDKSGKRFSVYDKKLNQYRDLQFKDIVILLRTTKNWTEVFCEELSNASIPTFADTGSGFFKTPEVQVVLSLLQIIDNPYQDIPLLSVLRSPIVNFTTSDLAELRLADRQAALFDALKLLAASDSDIGRRAEEFLQKLEGWRSISLYMSTHKLIWQLYNETGYFSIVGAMQDGERKQANLRVLFERSLQFEKTSYKGLFNFISFIDKLKTGKGDMGSAKVLGENDNVVRLMSIHKSKGLEFPVVFLCGGGKKFNMQDMYKSVLLHQELGFGPDFVDNKLRIKYPTVPKLAISEKVKLETLSEEMRILYVALTRAREKLILTGAVSSLEKAAARWQTSMGQPTTEMVQEHIQTQPDPDGNRQLTKLPIHEMLKAQNYLDWICPAVMRHTAGEKLRRAASTEEGFKSLTVDDESRWEIFFCKQGDIAAAKKVETDTSAQVDILEWPGRESSEDEIINGDIYREIDRRLSWKYRYSHLINVPTKISVTEIKRYFNINNEGNVSGDTSDSQIVPKISIRKPVFLQEKKGLSSAEKGTIMHFVMQHIDFRNNDIEGQISIMLEKELITRQQADSVDIYKIRKFIMSSISERMIAAGNLHREVPFNLELPYSELYSQGEISQAVSAEKILLQGVIDCYFEEDGKIILLDYKTDYIQDGNLQELKNRYGMQITYYARALEQLTGLPVSERYIYLFSKGELIEM